MLKENITVFRKLSLLADLCIITACFFAGYALRDRINDIYPLHYYLWLLPLFLVVWGGMLSYFGMYRTFRTKTIPDILLDIMQTALIGFGVTSSVIYMLKIEYVSRALILIAFLATWVFLSAEKLALVLIFRFIRRLGYNFRHILVVGTGRRAQNFLNLAKTHAEWGLKIIGLVDEDETKTGETIDGFKVIGTFKDVPDIIHGNPIDEIIFVVPRATIIKIEPLMQLCELEGITVSVATDYFELKLAKARQSDIHGFPMQTFESVPKDVWGMFLKRLFDITASGASLLLLSPVFAAVAIAVKATSPGPVLFKQERVSVNGRKFKLLKFRTMAADAESKLEELRDKNEMTGPVFKIKNDPRITKIGKFLRKYSLDELPQFWNVLTGDMSIVGPRPPLPSEVNEYDPWQRRRLSMRPGLTCIWQVSGRSRITDFNEWAKLDLEYIDNWSIWLDMAIFIKTIPVVLLAKGAK
ncbi:MAG: sugar transferase [Candidatus Omnitrophica bacterium]|nr:sugar transferase [Candidatus Omnitrophota bacterium]MDD5311205.1 sugar transferase [Candidatus Omnitrophota bacterium]MDD5546128.1 sugar transferase [Candidatus Omnitrophota bacterium]